MNELLKKLLEAEVLSADTKAELEAAFKKQLDEAIASAKEDAAADVRAQLTEQWVTERNTLIEAIDSKVGDFLNSELVELKDDIERFRDLDAEYAERLVEAKSEMAGELQKDLKELIEKIDAFLEIRIAAEIEELREDLDVVKKNQFGARIFEAFSKEFVSNYANKDSADVTVAELEHRLEQTSSALEESERKLAKIRRQQKLEDVLAPLSGRSRDVMEAILKNVDTDQLHEAYKTFIGRVIRESEADSEKEEKVLAESVSKRQETPFAKKAFVVTGDTDFVTEATTPATNEALERIRRIAGIK